MTDSKRPLGPNVNRLIVSRMSVTMIPAGGGLEAGIRALSSAENIARHAREATSWVFEAINQVNDICWQIRKPSKSGQERGTSAMMAGLAGHVWIFDELLETVLAA